MWIMETCMSTLSPRDGPGFVVHSDGGVRPGRTADGGEGQFNRPGKCSFAGTGGVRVGTPPLISVSRTAVTGGRTD